ncbi:C4-dicarboxylate TRAP transporter large permease protein DctM [bacterium HR40]|nr:C4-dicarboxylate TRAP transporter large permease protein DctM [bacterium HR40]
MSYEAIALLMFLSMLLLLATGQRVFGVIGFVGSLFALLLWGRGGFEMPFNAAFTLVNWYALVTLPLFVYMGYMFANAGIAGDLYRMFHVWSGPVRGGLAIGTILLMVLISAINGLSVAGMAIGATIAIPQMLARGYDKVMITGVVQAGSSLGILIPPSVVMVLYGMIARQPVGNLWLAGVLPGLMLAAMFIVYIAFRCWRNPALGPALPPEERNLPLREKIALLRAGISPLAIFFVMMGSFFTGVTSLVESAALGALATTVDAIVKRKFTFEIFHRTLQSTLSITCMFMWVITAALCFSSVFDGLGAIRAIEKIFLSWGLEPWQVILMMQLSYLILGMFLDDTAMLVIVAPLYIPLVIKLGYDPIWYGVIYTITCQIAYMTPPFGYNLFLMRAMAPPEISLSDIYRSVWPFVLIMIAGMLAVTAFPQIALWLPQQVYSR